jgi:hypothetical protein
MQHPVRELDLEINLLNPDDQTEVQVNWDFKHYVSI